MLDRIRRVKMENYHVGRYAAEKDVDDLCFDVDVAISSFDDDPPDSEFQRGYLRGLLKCGYATVSSKWDGVLV